MILGNVRQLVVMVVSETLSFIVREVYYKKSKRRTFYKITFLFLLIMYSRLYPKLNNVMGLQLLFKLEIF